MTPSIHNKLQQIAERREEIAALLAEPSIQNDPGRIRDLGRELAQIQPIADCYQQYCSLEQALHNAQEMLTDPELLDLAQHEIAAIHKQREHLEPELERLLIPPDPDDRRNIYLEIRAGTGGAKAALFAGDLHRAYLRYAELQGWQVEVLNESQGEHGGYKEIISRVLGQGVYARLKFESDPSSAKGTNYRGLRTNSDFRLHSSYFARDRRNRFYSYQSWRSAR